MVNSWLKKKIAPIIFPVSQVLCHHRRKSNREKWSCFNHPRQGKDWDGSRQPWGQTACLGLQLPILSVSWWWGVAFRKNFSWYQVTLLSDVDWLACVGGTNRSFSRNWFDFFSQWYELESFLCNFGFFWEVKWRRWDLLCWCPPLEHCLLEKTQSLASGQLQSPDSVADAFLSFLWRATSTLHGACFALSPFDG